MKDNEIITDVIDPVKNPEQAASQLLMAVIPACNFSTLGGKDGDFRSEQLISMHKAFTDYFLTLKK